MNPSKLDLKFAKFEFQFFWLTMKITQYFACQTISIFHGSLFSFRIWMLECSVGSKGSEKCFDYFVPSLVHQGFGWKRVLYLENINRQTTTTVTRTRWTSKAMLAGGLLHRKPLLKSLSHPVVMGSSHIVLSQQN